MAGFPHPFSTPRIGSPILETGEKMPHQDWSIRPPTLIPFDPVATLNDLFALLGDISSLAEWHIPLCEQEFVRFVVRYSTLPIEQLQRQLSSQGLVEFKLFHPELKPLRIESTAEGHTTIWSPNLPELDGYAVQPLSAEADVFTDCIFIELVAGDGCEFRKRPGSHPKTVLIAMTEKQLLSSINECGWLDMVTRKNIDWQTAREQVGRLRIRLANGQTSWLDVRPRWRDDVARLWHDLQTLIDAAGLEAADLPGWAFQNNRKKPIPPDKLTGTLEELKSRMTLYGSSFEVMRDLASGEFTLLPEVIDAGLTLQLPRFDNSESPEEVVGRARFTKLPKKCEFKLSEASEGQCRTEIVTEAECTQCGYRMTTRFLEPSKLSYAYRKCGSGPAVRQCRLNVDISTGTIWFDGKPCSGLPRSAIFLRALILRPNLRTSGRDINELFSDFPFNKASFYRDSLPDPIRKLIDTNSKGSILLPAAWIEETHDYPLLPANGE